ncbi:TetR/AcrR family transcriptional regulator C-terminal domain-containing protein [Haloimpatiens sp. FM7330]|uniref:TetR/AcrR family transcriptional regulator C-terminal domain-containing protein n=1 Tax=Haloimpatiens sp. FM7330 TaxID=3298610 RepID=UPI00362553EE
MPKNEIGKLNREKIFKAALAMLDEHGLDNLSMRKLGVKLGVKAMSLYNYVENKESLFDGIVDLIIKEMSTPKATNDWKADLHGVAYSFHTVLIQHPNALPLIATRPIKTQVGLEKVEYMLSILNRGKISGIKALYTLHVLVSFITGYAFLEVGTAKGEVKLNTYTSVEKMKTSIDLKQFPCIFELLHDMPLYNSKEEFDYGLELIFKSLNI